MKNFKEIAEQCLAGKLSGIFLFSNGESVHSSLLMRYNIGKVIIPDYYFIFNNLIDRDGNNHLCNNNVINFISDMEEQIKIDIPEGKVPVLEQTEKGVVITWKEKELTYADIVETLKCDSKHINTFIRDGLVCSSSSLPFYHKVEVLRKLTNIRNYFGGDKPTNSWVITIDSALRPYVINNPKSYKENCFIYFDTKEHAEQAIKMLGDELKYLFKPW